MKPWRWLCQQVRTPGAVWEVQLLSTHGLAVRKAHLEVLIGFGKRAKSLYSNLKQKEGDRSRAGDFNASKRWSDNFRTKFG